MTTLAILLIFIGLSLYAVKEYYQIKLGVIPKTTSKETADFLVRSLEVFPPAENRNRRLLHLGSGYGDLVLGLAKRLPAWEIDGLEHNPTPWLIAHMRSVGKNLGNYRFFLGDFTLWPLKDYDVIFINQADKPLARWEASIARRLQPGTVLMSVNGRLPRVKPVRTESFDGNNTLYVYERRSPAAPVKATDTILHEQPDGALTVQPVMEPKLDQMANPVTELSASTTDMG